MPRKTAAANVTPFPKTGTHLQGNLKRAGTRKPMGMRMQHDQDPAELLLEKLGDIGKIHVFNTYVLYAIYERPKVTKGGIHLTDNTTGEDEYQGKVGLIIKVGPMVNDEHESRGAKLEPGQWIAVRASDGWALKVNGVLCRMVNEKSIHMAIPAPDTIW